MSSLMMLLAWDGFKGGNTALALTEVMRLAAGTKCVSCGQTSISELAYLWLPLSLVWLFGLGFFGHRFMLWKLAVSSPPNVPETPRFASGKSTYAQRTFNYPANLEYNFFDPDNLPDSVKIYSDIVFKLCQDTSAELGFQIDNSRNQAEHLLMLLTNESSPADLHNNIAPPQRLHNKIFKNYLKWCDRVGAAPVFSHSSSKFLPPANLIDDLVVYLLVWGEASNLRHLPECLCYLYHKTMQDHIFCRAVKKAGSNYQKQFYPGYFLDMVVTPIYEVMSNAMKSTEDHLNRKTYDDFNEFFWSPECLKYCHHYDASEATMNEAEAEVEVDEEDGLMEAAAKSSRMHVAEGLKNAKKTYLEKRSWMHSLLSFHRVIEFHLVTFLLLSVAGFAETFLWSLSYTLQVASSAFWLVTFLGIIWTSLEVWRLYSTSSMTSGPSVLGYVLRLVAGLVILAYQSMYYHWTFLPDNAEEGSFRAMGSPLFWWWQYIWISMVSLIPYGFQFIMCIFPSVTSALMTTPGEIVQAILNVAYPFSELYVGKKLHVPQAQVFEYIFFWLTLLAFKLWFGYYYVILPVIIPTIELYDDYVNFENYSLWKTATLTVLLWMPHLLVYLIDLSIWYAVWAAVVGGLSALAQRQGAVRDIATFQAHFMMLPQAFARQIMPLSPNVNSEFQSKKASEAGKAITKPRSYGGTDNNSMATHGSKSRLTEGTKLLYQDAKPFSPSERKHHRDILSGASSGTTPLNDPALPVPNDAADVPFSEQVSTLNDFLDARSQRWVIFSRAWNTVIEKLRETDHLSNAEKEVYLFTSCEWFTKPVYLPLCITAGRVENALSTAKTVASAYHQHFEPDKKMLILERFRASMHITTVEALMEFWELSYLVLLNLLGEVHEAELKELFESIATWAGNDYIYDRISADGVQQVFDHISGLIGILNGIYEKRKKSPVATEEWLRNSEDAQNNDPRAIMDIIEAQGNKSMKKSVSYGFLAGLEQSTTEQRLTTTTSVLFQVEGNDIEKSISRNNLGLEGGTSKPMSPFTKLQPISTKDAFSDIVRDKVRDEVRSVLGALRNAFKAMSDPDTNQLRPGHANASAIADAQNMCTRIAKILNKDTGFLWNDVYASRQLDKMALEPRMKGILFKLNGLVRLRPSSIEPTTIEARRRLNFFVNSLFMEMPSPPPLSQSKDYTCITPYYSEDVLLSIEDLLARNSDGVSTLLYLQTIYQKEWAYFLERRGLKDDSLIWSNKHARETRIWASLRAQTLFRTVEGMMQTEAAIRFLGELESIRPQVVNTLAVLKFNYVVSCQVYGTMKRNMDAKTDDIEFLLSRHPNLRIAYIDCLRSKRDNEASYYSVLIKYDAEASKVSGCTKVKEVYRVKLPGNPVLGEGKPENQNHALIFSRGRFLQAIDMNQDGYFEEALKMRNLLEEFDSGCAILGFREHIFTGAVSSIANYMALQEKSFVTLGQRVLNWPLRVRQHYGHPDLFDKTFVMTQGGMSKPSKGINLSEDVFAGFNATIRGEDVQFKEYVQVGKGRDVGLQQTYKFEAKLAQGNAEQSLSRDMNRICDRLDFFRLLSFYFGGIGHYVANTMVMNTLFTVVYIMLILAIFDVEGINERPIMPVGVVQLLLAGMGILQTLPLMATLTVEKGVVPMLQEIAYMIISGGPLYFIFHIQTKCYYFQQTLLAGGAMYRPTGRGFVIRHSPFDENFRFFASSHILTGFEVFVALVLIGVYTKSKQYFGLTWGPWLIVISFLIGPFWFNPVSFDWGVVIQDYKSWMQWMGETGGRPEQSWLLWWREDNAFMNKLSFSWRITLFLQRCVPWIIVAYGICGSVLLTSASSRTKMLEIVALFAVFLAGNYLIALLERFGMYALRRFFSIAFTSAVFALAVYMIVRHPIYFSFAIALYYFIAAVALLLQLCGQDMTFIYKIHDYIVGHVLFFVILIMSLLHVSIIPMHFLRI
jgi:callose synthase